MSIGTAHGVYESAPNLDIARLAEIDKVSPVPLVLHGGSGTPEDQLRAAIANGIAKINIYSELTAAWNREMFEFLRNRREMTCWFSVSCRLFRAAAGDDARGDASEDAALRLGGTRLTVRPEGHLHFSETVLH